MLYVKVVTCFLALSVVLKLISLGGGDSYPREITRGIEAGSAFIRLVFVVWGLVVWVQL